MKIDFFNSSFLISGLSLLLLSALFFFKGRQTTSIVILSIASFFIGLFMANLDPFLNLWDEQFHALVAKNMLKNPFVPVLIRDPVFSFPAYVWTNAHIWLHKQPLFLWQMALSIKLFGINEVSVRLPSVLFHALSTLLIYRIAKIFLNDRIGYVSALFFSCAYFPLEYISGFYPTDHNDTAFAFYTLTTLWALSEYLKSENRNFIYFIGLSAGAAVLCKWLPGLLVYAVWFFILVYKRNKTQIKSGLVPFCISLLISLLIFVPWQLYALTKYPVEYHRSMHFNWRHIIEPLEGHGGNYLFYYDALYEQMGEGALIPLIFLATLVFMIATAKDLRFRIIVLVSVVLTYAFFTFVSTKMYGYVLGILPFFFIALAYTTDYLFEKLKFSPSYKTGVYSVLICSIAFFLFDHEKIYKHHSAKEPGRALPRSIKVAEKEMYYFLSEKFPERKCLIFNLEITHENHIAAMFYTDFTAYSRLLDTTEINHAKKLQYTLLAFDNGKLPDYVLQDPEIEKIKLKY